MTEVAVNSCAKGVPNAVCSIGHKVVGAHVVPYKVVNTC
jgi:hypothetical protein